MGDSVKNCYLVINPNRFPQYVRILKKILKKYNNFIVLESRDLDHFIECIEEFYLSKTPYLLVWGGDGTIHSAINHLTYLKNKYGNDGVKRAIGFLRGGSGNGIQDSYEVPFSILKQIKTYINSINKNCVIDVDLIEVKYNNKIEYTQLSGIGIDAKILRLRDKYKFRIGPLKGLIKPGLWNYFTAILRAFKRGYHRSNRLYSIDLNNGRYLYQGSRVNSEIRIDKLNRTLAPLLIEIGNRPYFAALYKVCPHVVCNSGSLDIYIYKSLYRRTILANLFNFWRGEHNKINDRFAKKGRPIIEHYELDECTIKSNNPFHFHLDGDLKKVLIKNNDSFCINYKILSKSITFLVPENFYNKFHPQDI